MPPSEIDDIEVGNLIEIIYESASMSEHIFAVKMEYNYLVIETISGNYFKKDYEYPNKDLNPRSVVIDHGKWADEWLRQ